MATQKPVHTIRRGRLEAAIWENPSSVGVFYRATFSRTYRTKDGRPASTASFGRRELSDLALLATQAQAWMLEHEPTSQEAAERAGEVDHD